MHFQDTTRRDLRKVVPSLRHVDRHEASITRGREATDSDITQGILLADYSLTIFDGSVPVGLWGVHSLGGGLGCPWLVGTDRLTRGWVSFARDARPVFRDLSRPFDFLTNQMLATNVLHRRFVEWLCSPCEWTPIPGTPLVRFYACASPSPRPRP